MGLSKAGKRKDIIFLYLLFYIFWGFVFTKTVFENRSIILFSFILFVAAFVAKTVRFGMLKDKIQILCLPYMAYTMLGYFLQFDFQYVAYWFVAILIILTGASSRISNRIEYKELYLFGLFAILGIMIQYFFPFFYHSFIAPLFVNDMNEALAENYGYAGFTYQLAATAEILLCAECVVITLWDKVSVSKRQWIKWPVVIVFIIAVFMTGKRTNSIIAISLPFIVNFFYQKSFMRRNMWLLLFGLLLVVLYYYVSNSAGLDESVVFRRTATSVGNYDMDIVSSGRFTLWGKAMDLFTQSPIVGIGVGNFRLFSGAGTDVHNIYLQCLCEQGIVGLLLFFIMILSCLTGTIKTIKRTTEPSRLLLLNFSLALQFSYLIEGITENMNINLEGFIIYSIAVALMLDCKNQEQINIPIKNVLITK